MLCRITRFFLKKLFQLYFLLQNCVFFCTLFFYILYLTIYVKAMIFFQTKTVSSLLSVPEFPWIFTTTPNECPRALFPPHTNTQNSLRLHAIYFTHPYPVVICIVKRARLQRLSLQLFAHQNIHECHLQVIFPSGLLIFHRIKRLIGFLKNLIYHPTFAIIYS